MRKIYIDRTYNEPFMIKHGKEVKEVTIPKGTNEFGVCGLTLSYLPNIENIICESDVYEFTDGVLYIHNNDNKRTIYYVTKGVKELKVDADIRYIDNLNDLEKIIVDKDNDYYTIIDNMLLNIEKTELIYVFSNSTTAIVPEGVTGILSNAFKDCRNLKKIVFPSTYEWYDQLIINENVKDLKVEIHGNKASVENDIVISDPGKPYARPKLYIGDSDRCTIPDGIKFPFFSGKPFEKVKYFEVTASNPNYVSVDGIILDKTGKELILYPPGRDYFTIPDTVEIIKEDAVYNTNLQEITIPENVKTIENYSFQCVNLKKVHTLNPDVDVRGHDGCDYLESIGGVVYFGNNAVSIGTRYSSEIRVREGTTVLWGTSSMAGFVFFGKTKVKIEKLFIPSSLKKIKGRINDPYKEIIVDENNQTYRSLDGVLFSKDLKTLIRYPRYKESECYRVPDGVECISDVAFHECRYLKHVVLPDSVRTIGHNAFSYSMLLSIEMKAQPTEIGELAIKPVRNLRYSGKTTDFTTKMIFRFGALKLPVLVENNWKENNDEIRLADFIESDSVKSKKECFLSVKNNQYKSFMALYLYLTDKDEDCRKYLSRAKKRIVEDALYDEFLNSIKQDEDWAFLFENKESKKKPDQEKESKDIGDEIAFGVYKWEDGEAPIEWIIIDATKNQYLLLSKYLVKCMPFYGEKRQKKEFIGWSRSDVRTWLNNDFLETAFSETDRNRICLKRVKSIGDIDTEDYIFIPSEKEFLKYVNTPEMLESVICFEHKSGRKPGFSEMVRKTWLKYSDCCIEIWDSHKCRGEKKISYMRVISRVDFPDYIRPMMWINKE